MLVAGRHWSSRATRHNSFFSIETQRLAPSGALTVPGPTQVGLLAPVSMTSVPPILHSVHIDQIAHLILFPHPWPGLQSTLDPLLGVGPRVSSCEASPCHPRTSHPPRPDRPHCQREWHLEFGAAARSAFELVQSLTDCYIYSWPVPPPSSANQALACFRSPPQTWPFLQDALVVATMTLCAALVPGCASHCLMKNHPTLCC